MARRGHHLTEVALLASAPGDLAAAGAGEREGWLDDPAVLPSLGPRARALAVASAARSVLVLVPIASGGRVTVKPALGPDEGRISAVEWIPLAGEGAEGEEGVAVAVDTDAGWLLFYSLTGDLLHKQSIYLAKILKLNFHERKQNAWEDSGSDELSVVFPGVIARFDGAGLQSMLQKSFQEVKSHMWKHKFEQEDAEDESSFGRIPFQIWNVRFGITSVRPAKVVRDGEMSAPCGAMVLHPKDGGNIHAFKAITPCAILDILSPPYSSEDGRHCSYFRRCPKSDPSGVLLNRTKGSEFVWLEEYQPPDSFVIRRDLYTGPALNF